MSKFKGRLGIIQRVLPRYRADFFDLLAENCEAGLGVFAGEGRPNESIPIAEGLQKAKWTWANNVHILSGPLYLCWQRGLKAWLDSWEPQCLVVEANPRYLSTQTAIHWMKSRFRPVIGWGLGMPPPRGAFSRWRLDQRKRFLHQFDAMIAYSQRAAREYCELGFPPDRVFEAPNAIVRQPAGDAPKRVTKSPNQFTVLYVGRLQERKRLDALIRACAGLPTELQPDLQIVGEGTAGAELKTLAAKVYPRTRFTGSRFDKELDEAFDQADLFVLPGSGGLAVQQAMAHGLPVIAAKGEDRMQEDLVQPKNGWLLEAESDSELQKALSEALSNQDRLRQMGAQSFELVQKEFNLEHMVDAFIEAVNRVAG